MKPVRLGPETSPADVRALVAAPPDVERGVRAILDEVRADGDEAVRRLTARFDRVEIPPDRLRVEPAAIERAVSQLHQRLQDALRAAIANVKAVARAQLGQGVALELSHGQRIDVVELPVRRAAAYIPAGRAPYPSSVVMCAATAQVAGVEQIVVCVPPGRDGGVHPAILAACSLCGVSEVYRMGGAQAIAALAYGTRAVEAVDVIVGPGNAWVQEAKRQLAGSVGIDGVAGPSELVVVATRGADPELAAVDLLAQAEHGPDSLVCAISPEPAMLAAIERAATARTASEMGAGARFRPPAHVREMPLALVGAADARAAVRLADALAPEHLELMGVEAETLAPTVRSAGALFVGRGAATAFGDYVAGSNHVLPTGGAARFASGLSVATFRRRMARVQVPQAAARALAGPGVALAAAEGFHLHAESMARRA